MISNERVNRNNLIPACPMLNILKQHGTMYVLRLSVHNCTYSQDKTLVLPIPKLASKKYMI